MKLKWLATVLLALSLLAIAETTANAQTHNPLQAKVVRYKHNKTFNVEFVQTNLLKLNKELENLYCDYAFGNESDMEDCKKQDIQHSIDYSYTYHSENDPHHFSQNYTYLTQNNKQYFQVGVMLDDNSVDYYKIYDITNPKKAILLNKDNMPLIENMGFNSRYIHKNNEKYFLSCLSGSEFNDCHLYNVKNPQQPVLLEDNVTTHFLNEQQINKIVSFYLAQGNYFDEKLTPSCQKAIVKHGIQLNATDEKRIPQAVKKQCSPQVIKEINDIDNNHSVNKITLSKNDKTYTIHILTWEVWRGRWGSVDVPNEKILETLIPRDLWDIFMGK